MARSSRTRRVTETLAFALPFGLAAVLCLVARPAAASLVAPALGPWAGVLYGHQDCTLGSVLPALSLGIAGAGAVLLVTLRSLRPGTWHTVVLVAAALWALAWETAALISVVNSTS
jgi:hypothetical protein